jgi:HAD superfamily hydrolase (TIGR01509 family)
MKAPRRGFLNIRRGVLLMIEAVIFDMDGVLIDSEPISAEINMKLFNEWGLNVTQEEYDSYIGTNSYFMWDSIKSRHNLLDASEDLIKKQRLNYFNYLKTMVIEPIEGIRELIEDLNKNRMKLAVASSSPLNIIEHVVKTFGFDKYFDAIVTGDNVEKSKPEPDIFLYAAKVLGVDPKSCIVIEVSHNGVTAARSAGMKCIGFKNPNSGNQDLSIADKIITSYKEIDINKLNEV